MARKTTWRGKMVRVIEEPPDADVQVGDVYEVVHDRGAEASLNTRNYLSMVNKRYLELLDR